MDNSTAYRAVEYDAKIRQTIPFYDAIHTQTVKLVKLIKPAAECWVDTGCGTGHLVQQALGLFPKTRFFMADPSAAMLEQSRERLTKTAGQQLTILPPCGTGELPQHMSASKTDVITAIQCHHYLRPPARAEALQACFTILKPGGLLISFENIAPRTPEGVRIGMAEWKDFLVLHGRTAEEAEKQVARYNVEFFPITLEEHLRAFEKAGFQTVEVFWYSCVQAGFYALKGES